jgi:hypothetical protein
MAVANFIAKQWLYTASREMPYSSCLRGSTSSAIRKIARRRFLDLKSQFRIDPVGGSDDFGLSLADLTIPSSGSRSTVRLLAKSSKNGTSDKGFKDEK